MDSTIWRETLGSGRPRRGVPIDRSGAAHGTLACSWWGARFGYGTIRHTGTKPSGSAASRTGRSNRLLDSIPIPSSRPTAQPGGVRPCGLEAASGGWSSMRVHMSGPTSRLVMTGLFCLVLGACLPSQWEYLIEAADRATQDEVRKRMGSPSLTKDMPDGDSVWTYRYEVRSSLVGRRGDMVGGSPCMASISASATQSRANASSSRRNTRVHSRHCRRRL